MRLGLGVGLSRGRGGAASAPAATLVSQAAWTRCFEAGAAMLPSSPGDFATWTDRVGGSVQITSAGAGHAQTTTDPSVRFTNNANQRLHAAAVLTTGADFGIFTRMKTTDGALWTAVAFDRDGAATAWVTISIVSTGIFISVYAGAEETLSDTFAVANGTYYRIFLGRAAGTLTLRVDARTAKTVASVQNVSSLSNLSLGNMVYAGPTSYQPGNGDVSDVGWKTDADFTAPERTAILAYIAGRP